MLSIINQILFSNLYTFIRNWCSKTVRKYRKEEKKTIADTDKLKF